MRKLLLNLLLLLVMAIGATAQETLTVYDGTVTNSYVPVYGFYTDAYLKAEYVIPESDLDEMLNGTITGMKFYSGTSSASWGAANFQVFLKEYGSETISAYSGPDGATIVYEGALSISGGEMEVTFTTPYVYDGGNLLVGFYNTAEGSYVSCSWYGQNVTGASYQGYSYSSLSEVSGYQRDFIPKTTFTYTPGVAPSCPRPSGLTVSDIAVRSASVSWTPGASETSWQLCINDDEDALITVNEPTYVMGDLSPESDYTVRVRAVCGDDEFSLWTSNRSFTTLIACPAPTALHMTTIAAHSATAVWTSGASETSWIVCLDGDEDAAFEVTDTTYTITGLAPESDYTIKVRANCGGIDGVSAWTNTISYTTTVSCPAPTNLALAAYTTTTATLTWDALEAESWLLLYGTDSEFGADTYTELSLTEPTVELTGLTPETVYYARVMANCGVEGESDWSSTISFEPTAKIVIGSGTATNSYLPTYTYYKYALSQQIYTAAEIGAAGYINSVDFYNAGTVQTRNLNVYVVPTNKTSFASGSDWINATDDYLVFSGNVTFASNVWTSIQFTTPLYYNGTTNLAIIVDDNTGGYESSMGCRVFEATSQAIQIYNDYTDYAPTAPAYDGTLMNVKNQIRLLVEAGDPPACTKPLALAVSNISGHTATATWSAGAEETAWQVCLNDDEDNPIDVTEATYTITGLAPESDYTVKIRSNCGENGYSDWTSNVSFTTLVACPAPTDLEASTIGMTAATLTWTAGGTETAWQLVIDGDNDNIIELDAPTYTMTGLVAESDYTAKVRAVCGGEDGESEWTAVYGFTTASCEAEDQCLISYSFTDSYGDGWNGNAIKVKDVLTNQVLATWTIDNGSSAAGSLSVCNGREITFEWISDSYPDETSYVVTDVNGDEIFSGSGALSTVNHVVNCSSCRVPSALQANNVAVTTAEVSWNAPAEQDAWQICINNDEENIIDVTETTYQMSGLTELTTYTVKVRSNCGAEQSPWITTSFTTLSACPAPTNVEVIPASYSANISWNAEADSYIVRYRESADQILFSEDFEGGMPSGWSTIDADGDGYDWIAASLSAGVYHNDGVSFTGTCHNSSNDMIVSGSFSNAAGMALTPDNWLVTSAIELPQNAEHINFRFYVSAQDVSYAEEHYGVYISTTSATDVDAFTMLWEETLDANGGSHRAGAWGEKNTDITAYAGETVYIAIRHFDCTDMFILNIDDVSVSATVEANEWITINADASPVELTGLSASTVYEYQIASVCGDDDDDNWTEIGSFETLPSCLVPTNVTVSNITAHTAVVSWTPSGEEAAWQISVNGDEDELIFVESTSYTFENLSSESSYSVRVRAYCEVDDQSAWSGAVNFTTLVSCPVPTALIASNVTATTATLTWTAGGEEAEWTLQYGTDNTFADYTEITCTTDTVDLEDLTPETIYYARVKANCGEGDESQWSAVCVFNPSAAMTIGTAESTNSYLPTYTFYNYTLSQQIYTADEIGTAGTISSIAFYNAGSEKTRTLDVYVTMTDKSSFTGSTDWVAVEPEYRVFSGSVTFVSSVWTTITFDTPFEYDGTNNLLITVDDNSGSYSSGLTCNTFAATSQAIRFYSDTDNQDPASPTASGTIMDVKNQIRLLIEGVTTYTITATAGENGSITPSGNVNVVEGGEQAFTITPDATYRILSVLVDGNEVVNELENGVYTFTNVTANHTIAATFVSETAVTYTITATAGEHGTITPSGSVAVVEGADQAFVITPDTDYKIDVLTVDGNEVALTDEECDGYTYTFTSVYGGHTINVTFTSLNNVEINNVASMSVYPNPNNGMFSIDFSNIEGKATYQLIDARGAVVETREINVANGETKMFNHKLNAGTYFVRIINGDKVYVEQIVVE